MDKRTAAAPLIIAVAAGLAIAGSPDSAAQPDVPTPERFGRFPDRGRRPDRFASAAMDRFGHPHAKGYTTAAAEQTSVAGMKADCDNINLNKKLSTDFLQRRVRPRPDRVLLQVREQQPRHQSVLVHHRIR